MPPTPVIPLPTRQPGLIVGFIAGSSWQDRVIADVAARRRHISPFTPHPLATHAWAEDASSTLLIEAVPPYVHTADPAIYRGRPGVRRYRLPLDAATTERALTYMLYQVGRSYSFPGDVACGIYDLTGIALPTLRRAFFCSQLVDAGLARAGVRLVPEAPDDCVDPSHLEDAVIAFGGLPIGADERPAPRAA